MMRGVVAYLAAMLMAGTAQAGAWEEFERRCLVPMENVQEPVTEGLRSEHFPDVAAFPEDRVTAYYFDSKDLVETKFFLFVVSDSSGQALQCVVALNKIEGPEAFLSIAEWMIKNENKYKRVLVDMEQASVWHSNGWREPVLSVVVGKMESGILGFLAQETDLES